MFDWSFRAASRPAHFYLAMFTATNPPTHATKTMSELVEIASGHGYSTGGFQLNPNSTDFNNLTEDDTRAFTDLDVKTIAFTASGGDIPASGSPALYLALTTDESTVANRQIVWYQTFRSPHTILSGLTFTISGITERIRGGSVIKSIQRGTISMSAVSSATATISAVDVTKSVIEPLGISLVNSGAQDPQATEVRLQLTNSTTVTAVRGTNTISISIEFQVTEYW
jgi:hypothetical protein